MMTTTAIRATPTRRAAAGGAGERRGAAGGGALHGGARRLHRPAENVEYVPLSSARLYIACAVCGVLGIRSSRGCRNAPGRMDDSI